MKGFKAFDKDLKCRDMQFKVGKTYKITESIELCKTGLHFCKNAFDVYNYYPKAGTTRICEVEALGDVKEEGDKSATNELKIIRELTDIEKLDLWIKRNNSGYSNSGNSNSGHYNSGHSNSGYSNSGNSNSGYSNSGNYNSGNSNSGDYNSGDYNSGYSNSGYSNSGNSNSGHYNSGHYNSGDYNSGDYNSGYFNNTNAKVRLFNKDTCLEFTDAQIQRIKSLNIKPILQWITTINMTDQEKVKHPSHKTTGGFLRSTGRTDYSQLTDDDKKAILALPGYDDDVFKDITGISLKEPDTIQVTVNGVVKTISKEDAKKAGLI